VIVARLLLVRHGETELNSAQRYWGATDVKLGALGMGQAERLRDHLATERISAIYSSSLQRALTTAETIATRHQLPITPCAELREINFGQVEGLNYEEIGQLFPELAAKMNLPRDLDLQFPGGESLAEMGHRVIGFLDRLVKHTEGETVLIVAHTGVLRILICRLMGIELLHVYHLRLDLASLSILETYPEGAILERLNDISHLDGLKALPDQS